MRAASVDFNVIGAGFNKKFHPPKKTNFGLLYIIFLIFNWIDECYRNLRGGGDINPKYTVFFDLELNKVKILI